MAAMTAFFSRCLLEGAVVVRTPAEEVLLQGGNPSQVSAGQSVRARCELDSRLAR
jgi:hypothetical protein